MWDEVGHGSTACDQLFTQIQPYNHDLDIVVSPSALRYNAYKALMFKKKYLQRFVSEQLSQKLAAGLHRICKLYERSDVSFSIQQGALPWQPIFTARCYASAVLAMALCPSVRSSVCPSQVGVLLKRLNVGSHKQHRTISQGL